MGNACGSVGRAVASNFRGLQFKSRHWQKFILNVYCQLYWKDEGKGKGDRDSQFLKKDNEQNESKLDQRKYLQAFGLDSSLKTGLWKDKRMGQEWFHIS